ncbi:MAG TPA: hypothetical protein VFA33_10025 [Bryobacteraceae bacterium]|nr:hypothetical protein [Bryobacteraceae bacterium]
MKKLMTVLLGLSFLAGTVTATFAQEKTQKTQKKKSHKKKGETKKEGTR